MTSSDSDKLTPPITTPLSRHPLLKAAAVFRPFYRPIWRAVTQWIDADGLRMSAAMSFTVFEPGATTGC
jgi:hypothetical protein